MESSTPPLIVCVRVNETCVEVFPCVHDVEVQYSDGSVHKSRMNGKWIWQKFASDSSVEFIGCDREHFGYCKNL